MIYQVELPFEKCPVGSELNKYKSYICSLETLVELAVYCTRENIFVSFIQTFPLLRPTFSVYK